MSRHTDAFDVFYLTQLDMMTEVLSEWSDGDYYIEKMKRVRTILMDRGANAFAPDPNHFNTLIHGDLYVLFLGYFATFLNRDFFGGLK